MPRPGLLDVIACAWDLDRDVSSWLSDLSDAPTGALRKLGVADVSKLALRHAALTRH